MPTISAREKFVRNKNWFEMDRRYYVYILQCKDGSYYTGVTNNIERRLWEHETGDNPKC